MQRWWSSDFSLPNPNFDLVSKAISILGHIGSYKRLLFLLPMPNAQWFSPSRPPSWSPRCSWAAAEGGAVGPCRPSAAAGKECHWRHLVGFSTKRVIIIPNKKQYDNLIEIWIFTPCMGFLTISLYGGFLTQGVPPNHPKSWAFHQCRRGMRLNDGKRWMWKTRWEHPCGKWSTVFMGFSHRTVSLHYGDYLGSMSVMSVRFKHLRLETLQGLKKSDGYRV